MNELLVLPTERHVERAIRQGSRAGIFGPPPETRAALLERLLVALAPHVALATATDVRLALAFALEATNEAPQMSLFGGDERPRSAAVDDTLLGPMCSIGGASWVRMVRALDGSIGRIRAAGVTAEPARSDLRATAGTQT